MNTQESSSSDATSTSEENGVVKKKVTDKDVEKWEVAQLKGEIAPCSRPTALLEKLAERRKSRHENLLLQFSEDLQGINLKTENNVKLSSEELKAHMKYFSDKLQDILEMVDVAEVKSYDNAKFSELQTKASEYKCEERKMIDELYDDLIKFENERAAECQKILRATCEEMTKIGYFLPYKVQTFVESQALVLNQLSLNNRRNYEDLKLTLTLVSEQKFRSFFDKLECIKEGWIQRKLEEAFSNLQIDAEKKVTKTSFDFYSRLELKGRELVFEMSPSANFTTCKAEEWSRNVQETVAVLETHGKNLIEIYKTMLNGIYQNFNRQTEDIKVQLNSIQILDIEERIIKPIMFDKQKQMVELEMYWQDCLVEIRAQLKNLSQFLIDVGKLWDNHAERVCECQKLITMALNKANESNQAVLQDLEIKLNIALDNLRQEHNRNELEKCYEAAVTILNSIKAKYESIYLNDVSIIEDYYKMMELEADVLSAEFKEFVYEIFPLDPSRLLHCYSDPYRTIPNGTQIVKIIAGCVQQIKAVKQWKFGIWSALSALSDRAKETLEPRAEEWVERKIENLADKKTLQLELVEKRFGRVRVEIFEKRQREIETHEAALSNHQKNIQNVYTQLKGNFDCLMQRELQRLSQIRVELEESQEKATHEDRPGVVRGKQIMAQRNKEEIEEEIRSNFEKFRADCEIQIFDLKQANINIMKSIKLFHEGGDYSSEEGKKFATMLEEIDKELNTELKNFVKESSRKENDLVRKVSAIFAPAIALLSLLYEETSFKWEIQESLQFFQVELLEITETLKSDFDLLNKQTYCLAKMINNKSRPLNESLCKFWKSLLKLLYINVSNLFYPMEFYDTPVPSIKAEEEEEEEEEESVKGEFFFPKPCCCNARFPIKSATSKTFLTRTADTEASFTCKDFKNELFGSDNEPENDGTFMGAVEHRLWSVMNTLQKAACVFYKKLQGRKILRTDLIPPNYEALIKDILVRLKSYNNQCEQFWLRAILDFLPLLGRMKTMANFYIERRLNEYDYKVQAALKSFEGDFVACLEYQSSESQKELEDLSKKLLTLHGYPQNRDLLNSLEEEVVRRTAGLGVNWESAIKKFKSHVKCFRIHHVGEKFEISKIESHYLKLKDILFVNDLGNGLLDTIMSYYDAGGFCPKEQLNNAFAVTSRLKSKTTNSKNKEMPEAYDLGLNPKGKWTTTEQYLNQLKDLVERERFTDERPSECLPCPEGSVESFISEENLCARLCASPLHILLKFLDFNEYSEEILNRMNLCLRRLKAFAVSQENVHEQNLFKWLNYWKFNVKKVQKLYQVKREVKPEPENETTPIEIETANGNQVRYQKNSSLIFISSPREYRGQIPLLKRHSLSALTMSPPVTRFPSPIKKNSPKEKQNKIKTISFEQDIKKNTHGSGSRSPSPIKRERPPINCKKTKPTQSSSTTGNTKSLEKTIRRGDVTKITSSPRINSSAKKKANLKLLSSTNLELVKESVARGVPLEETNILVLKQSSQPSLSQSEKLIQPQEKISLDHLKNEVYTGDHKRLSFEKVHLCIEKKEVQTLDARERKRSYLLTYSSEDLRNEDDISLSFLKNLSKTSIQTYSKEENSEKLSQGDSKSVIQTLSGHELVITPSMKLHVDKEEVGCDEFEISKLLNETEGHFENQKDVQIPQDEASEYDSEVSTDGELARMNKSKQQLASRVASYKDMQRRSSSCFWKSKEAELLNDVDYRQSVYHPAVSRRQTEEIEDSEFRPKSKSIENNHHYTKKSTDTVIRSQSQTLKNLSKEKMGSSSSNTERSWPTPFDSTDGKACYSNVLENAPLYDVKRVRTNKERISGALLHFTLKIIRLLAIFNFWPGDNCYILTSQSLRFTR